MNLTVRCVGNGEIALADLWMTTTSEGQPLLRLAELVESTDELILRRVNRETLTLQDYPELGELVDDGHWQMEAVEALVMGYLNRHSVARVRLHPTWESKLRSAEV